MRLFPLLGVCAVFAAPVLPSGGADEEGLPDHVTPQVVQSVDAGLAYLAEIQAPDGGFTTTRDGAQYPVAMTALAGMAFLASGSTSSRGPWAEPIAKAQRFLMDRSTQTGLIADATEDSGRPMFGHGFALLFLATLYGMENDPVARREMSSVIERAVTLTARGQSNLGGWMYNPGGGDEGSVTITQMQGLRAAHNSGFVVPQDCVDMAIGYLERCRTSEGGIRYSASSGDSTELPITAAAVATLYNAGDYDSELAGECLEYTFKALEALERLSVSGSEGHVYYTHLYASQAFYTAGDTFWEGYFPRASSLLMEEQSDDGSWMGDGVGTVYGTAIACIVLQLPYKFLPIYQR